MKELIQSLHEFMIPVAAACGGLVVWLTNWFYNLKKKKREDLSEKRKDGIEIAEIYKRRSEDAERRENEAMMALQEMAPKLKEVYEKHIVIMDRLGKTEVSLSVSKNALNEILAVANHIESLVAHDNICDESCILESTGTIKRIVSTAKNVEIT